MVDVLSEWSGQQHDPDLDAAIEGSLLVLETTVGGIVDSRRAEMLQQANALDERESFSSLRRLAGKMVTIYPAYHVQPAGTSGDGRGV